MGRAFFSTLTVTIPATIIPICIAAFAAYALAWMDFPGRALLIAIVVGLLVVPLQLALIPLLKLHLQIGVPGPASEIDLEAVAAVFPYGQILPIQIEHGGLLAHSGIALPAMGDKNDDMIIAVACVTVGY